MSYAVRSAHQARASPPPTTAAVLDFICLFTHDLRRKQKRWQDGKLKFHTFNKRYMVYDDRGNFIGDGHWKDGADEFDEGVELELDRGSAIVQVSECTGSREQDLTEILDKRAREVEKRRATAAAKTPVASARSVRHDAGPSSIRSNQSMNRPLSDIVPNSGPIGRAAISDRSPFETRRSLFEHEVPERAPPAKKRRVDVSPPSKKGHAQSLFGTRLTLSTSSVPYSSWRARVVHEKTNVQAESRENKLQDDESEEEKEEEITAVTIEQSPSPVAQPPRLAKPAARKVIEARPPLSERSEPIKREAKTSTKPKKSVQAEEFETEIIPSSQYEEANHQRREEKPQEIIPVESTPEPDVKPRIKPKKPTTSLLRKLPPEREKHKLKPHKRAELSSEFVTEEDLLEDSDITTPLDLQGSESEKKQKPRKSTKSTSTSKKVAREIEDSEPKRKQSKPSKATSLKEKKKAEKKTASESEDDQVPPPKKDKTRQTKKQDATTKSVTTEPVPPKSVEQRTELRIKPRQRRGLLMLSEKIVPPSVKEPTPEPPPPSGQDDGGKASDASPEPVPEEKDEVDEPPSPPPPEPILEEEDKSDEPPSPLTESTPPPEPILQDEDEVDEPLPPLKEPSPPPEPILEDKDEVDESLPPPKEPSPPPALEMAQKIARDISSDESDEPVLSRARRRPQKPDVDEISEPEIRKSSSPKRRIRKSRVASPTLGSSDESVKEVRRTSRGGKRKAVSSEEEEPKIHKSSPPERPPRKSRVASHTFGSNDESMEEVHRTTRRGKPKAASSEEEEEEEPVISSQDEESYSMPSKATKRKKAKSEQTDEGPRITKMARKSVKSKEIFGFVMPDAVDLIPASIMSMANRPVITSEAVAPPPAAKAAPSVGFGSARALTVIDMTDSDKMESSENEQTRDSAQPETKPEVSGAPKPRIVNPATRGKKAARKEDAAGQVPQCIIPFDPVIVKPRIVYTNVNVGAKAGPSINTNSTNNANANSTITGAASIKPVTAKSLPGFSAANGGAWSRHAEDLLGMTRPAARVSRR
ncbi:hypothetical protein PT974_01429 [Cladobotryum mycophilum]|uniref:5'-3' DNA helicase ZGRF1-like N-terminal domain-containing protein n=1 Tax=Cladobotryum mycophilum TaxID=491253 RepID=A0ABR0T3Q0_9HYPO